MDYGRAGWLPDSSGRIRSVRETIIKFSDTLIRTEVCKHDNRLRMAVPPGGVKSYRFGLFTLCHHAEMVTGKRHQR